MKTITKVGLGCLGALGAWLLTFLILLRFNLAYFQVLAFALLIPGLVAGTRGGRRTPWLRSAWPQRRASARSWTSTSWRTASWRWSMTAA